MTLNDTRSNVTLLVDIALDAARAGSDERVRQSTQTLLELLAYDDRYGRAIRNAMLERQPDAKGFVSAFSNFGHELRIALYRMMDAVLAQESQHLISSCQSEIHAAVSDAIGSGSVPLFEILAYAASYLPVKTIRKHPILRKETVLQWTRFISQLGDYDLAYKRVERQGRTSKELSPFIRMTFRSCAHLLQQSIEQHDLWAVEKTSEAVAAAFERVHSLEHELTLLRWEASRSEDSRSALNKIDLFKLVLATKAELALASLGWALKRFEIGALGAEELCAVVKAISVAAPNRDFLLDGVFSMSPSELMNNWESSEGLSESVTGIFGGVVPGRERRELISAYLLLAHADAAPLTRNRAESPYELRLIADSAVSAAAWLRQASLHELAGFENLSNSLDQLVAELRSQVDRAEIQAYEEVKNAPIPTNLEIIRSGIVEARRAVSYFRLTAQTPKRQVIVGEVVPDANRRTVSSALSVEKSIIVGERFSSDVFQSNGQDLGRRENEECLQVIKAAMEPASATTLLESLVIFVENIPYQDRADWRILHDRMAELGMLFHEGRRLSPPSAQERATWGGNFRGHFLGVPVIALDAQLDRSIVICQRHDAMGYWRDIGDLEITIDVSNTNAEQEHVLSKIRVDFLFSQKFEYSPPEFAFSARLPQRHT